MRATLRLLCAALLLLAKNAAAERQPWTTSQVRGAPGPAPKYKLERGFSGVQFTNPLDLACSTVLDRWFVAEQGGKIFSIARDGSGQSEAADLGPLQGRDGALYGMAFDPGFATNRFFYACYAMKPDLPDGTRVSRFKVSGKERPRIDLASEEILITWLSGGHNGGCLKFGPDGFLYISTGDGAGPNPPDPLKTGQDCSDLLSSVLRIDVHRTEGARKYAVPKDNPFAGMEKVRPEIWAYGFRNPWRMALDAETGELWVADVGWELWELVCRVQRGGNYGWSIVEGRQPVLPDDPRGPTPILPPTWEHPHSEAASITGGLVYRGGQFPDLRGAFVYGDWETGKIWALKADRERVLSVEELTDSTIRVVSFEAGPAGEIAVLDYNGGIYWLARNPKAAEPSQFPARLSETGLFASVPEQRPAAGVYPFQVTAPMWRDFARAERWAALPELSRIDPRERPWKFPSNAVLALTFSMEMSTGRPESMRRLETQLLHNTGDGWGAYTYRWNREQTDAELVPAEGADEMLEIEDAGQPGGVRRQPWRYHARTECLRCHNPWCGTALGFQPEQLSSSLSALNDLAFFSARPKQPFVLASPHNEAASLGDRARSYLHANCSHCHRENAGGSVPSVMNFDLPLEKTRMLGARPVLGDLGLDAGKIIAPGDPFGSVLLFRASATGRSRMPYLSSELVDDKGISLLREWIASLGAARETPVIEHPRNTREALRLAHEAHGYPIERRVAIAREQARSANPLVRDLFDRFLPAEEQASLINPTASRESILAQRGDARRGQALLADPARTSCTQCHVVAGHGKAFGPDLAAVARLKTRAQILDGILNPSKEISPGFELCTIETEAGEPISGIVTKRTELSVFLRDASGMEHVIAKSGIKEMRRQQLSAMPEGLLNGLSAQEAADLVEAIAALAKQD